jgi:hypothetical protein
MWENVKGKFYFLSREAVMKSEIITVVTGVNLVLTALILIKD